MSDLKILVAGAAGRMGRVVMREALLTDGMDLCGGFEAAGHELLGKDLGQLAGLEPVSKYLAVGDRSCFEAAHAVIDFTAPDASIDNARLAVDAGVALVLGTTGFNAIQEEEIRRLSKRSVIVKSGNMSLGVNLIAHFVREAAARLGREFDIEIFEAHHRDKKDAPSGTALMLGAAAAKGRSTNLESEAVFTRNGLTGARPEGAIGFSVFRGGGVVGDHDVTFAAASELVTFSHRALDRSLFAKGAITAAKWTRDKTPGLYSMADVLGLPAD